eukprot:CAMPEP_0197252444 /NCGR_PEP_ID=MMETSP1429-20130617/61402_1 /TAXON_ID=49237 /ORGANISM="Chaetoceros  sp., Strain UNC1202" /LENGTH=148 /DNA_ID=CAMNT_0042714835 /DNA_START=13 /DNA_END=460 /DNA_ORIENTATION=-
MPEKETDRTVGAGGGVVEGTNHQMDSNANVSNGIVSNHDNANNGTGATAAPATHFDTHRFEKISNIVKQFKLSCEKAQSQFQGMEVSNSRFSAFIDAFTANTYIMVIVSNPNVHTAATLLNIKNAGVILNVLFQGVEAEERREGGHVI